MRVKGDSLARIFYPSARSVNGGPVLANTDNRGAVGQVLIAFHRKAHERESLRRALGTSSGEWLVPRIEARRSVRITYRKVAFVNDAAVTTAAKEKCCVYSISFLAHRHHEPPRNPARRPVR